MKKLFISQPMKPDWKGGDPDISQGQQGEAAYVPFDGRRKRTGQYHALVHWA